MTANRRFVSGHYPWPFDGDLRAGNTALLIIDVQQAHCHGPGRCGNDQDGADPQSVAAKIAPVLMFARQAGFTVMFTRQGHRPDLSDLPETHRWRAERRYAESGIELLRRGDARWQIVPELEPRPGEPIVDKPAMSSFFATDLDHILRRGGVRNLIVTGLYTDGSIQATLRDANDRGYECLLLEDCCAAIERDNHHATVRMLRLLCGLYGSVSQSDKLLEVLS
jgi:biuret amidohydrolase